MTTRAAVDPEPAPSRASRCGHAPRRRSRSRYPGWVIDALLVAGHHPAMRVASPATSARPGRRSPGLGVAIRQTVVGVAWLAMAVLAAWLAFGTPLLARLAPLDVRTAGGTLLGAAAWAVAFAATAAFAILGVMRLLAAYQRVRKARPALPPVARMAAQLPPGCTVIPRIQLPDGRHLTDVVIGPHGVAFFHSLPPRAAVRRTGAHWEVRFADHRWRPIENPLDRAVRDSERLRRYLDAQERDFVVRINAAVLGDDHDLHRIEGCAVVALADVPAWLAALPGQRGLGPQRLDQLREHLELLA